MAIQLARTPKKAEASAAARPSAAEKGGSGVSPDTTQHAHAQKKAKRSGQAERSTESKRSDHAERSGKRAPLNLNNNQRAATARINAERPVCKTKRR
jgi:type IV secretory pathway TrbL component